MVKEAKKIRITEGEYWYEDMVGEVLEVSEDRSTHYIVAYDGSTEDYGVDKTHCEVVDSQADRIEDVCNEVRDLLIRKNHDYGDSFSKQFEKYGVLSGMIRMDDKMRRLETLIGGEEAQVAESVDDTAADLAGYALLTLVELRKQAK